MQCAYPFVHRHSPSSSVLSKLANLFSYRLGAAIAFLSAADSAQFGHLCQLGFNDRCKLFSESSQNFALCLKELLYFLMVVRTFMEEIERTFRR